MDNLHETPCISNGHLAVSAVVTLGNGKSLTLEPNDLGLYPQVIVAKGQSIPIFISYADGEPGEVLIVSAEDGGKLSNGIPVITTKLDANRTAKVFFTTSQDEGIFRVTVRRGAEQTQFNFWVGAEHNVQTTSL